MPRPQPKLHELLPVEAGLKGQEDKTRGEQMTLFSKKAHHFQKTMVTFTPKEEGAEPVVEQQSTLQTTVEKELKWYSTFLIKSLNASFQVAEANTVARASVILEDQEEPLISNVPATALLELEKRIGSIRELVSTIPTLDESKDYEPDADAGDGVYKARVVVKERTKKIKQPIVLYEATKEHPAQVHLADADVPVGKLEERSWSSLLTHAEKADMLDRCDMLLRAVKAARARANEVVVNTDLKIGKQIADYIFG